MASIVNPELLTREIHNTALEGVSPLHITFYSFAVTFKPLHSIKTYTNALIRPTRIHCSFQMILWIQILTTRDLPGQKSLGGTFGPIGISQDASSHWHQQYIHDS
jgi:hypothetical protein